MNTSDDPSLPQPLPALERFAARRPILLYAAAAVLFVLLSLLEMLGESCTSDEAVHLAAGYSYLTRRDFRMNPEHPPLAKMLSAVPLLFQKVAWPSDGDLWKHGSEWLFGYAFLYEGKNDPDKLLFWGRLPSLLWGLLTLGAVYATARKFFGEPAGFISLCLATFCPPLLAHSHLVHTDAAMTALLFLTLLAFMKMAESWSIKWSVGCGLLLGASLAAKFSAVLLLPIALLIGLARVLGDRVPGGLRSGWSRLRPSAAMAWGCALALLVAYVEIWAWYGFRYGCSPDGSFTLAWQFDKLAATPAGRLLKLAYDHHLLPQAYAYGLAHVASHSEEGHSAYALGQYSNTGWWWYFPFAFLVKTPAPTLIVIGWGLYAVWRRALSGPVKEVPLLLALLVYGVSAMSSNINIGIRHILPAYPLLLTLAGGAVQAVDRTTSSWRWTRRAALALTATTALGCLAGAPYFLADFNLPSTLVLQRHEMLGDSNLDWGQDLGRLKRYLDRHHIGSIKLAYCGVASPRHLGLRHDVLPAGNIYSQQEREWRKTSEIVPGDLVAVSATCLVGIVAEDKNYYLRVFKDLKPEATIGHSIFLYRIPDRDRRGD